DALHVPLREPGVDSRLRHARHVHALLARLGQPAAQFGSLLALSVRFGLVPELVLALALVIHTLIQPHRSVRGAPHLGEQGVPRRYRQLAACLLQSLSHLPRPLQLTDVHKFSILLLVRSVRRRLAQVPPVVGYGRSEEHTSELQSRENLVCRLLLEKKKNTTHSAT